MSCFQDALSHVLEDAKWQSRPDFTAVVQAAPLILERTPVFVSGEAL